MKAAIGTRWKYMKSLTSRQLASYLCEAYDRRHLRTFDLMNNDIDKINEWLTGMVDEDGEEVEV